MTAPPKAIAIALAVPAVALMTGACWLMYAACVLTGYSSWRDMPPPFARKKRVTK